jgi:hypothetical protein
MLYTLFSPSEAKEEGGSLSPINSKSFIFPSLYEKRAKLLKKFDEHKSALDEQGLLEFFELKVLEQDSELRESIFDLPTRKALLRYSGVAYKALDFYSLSPDAKTYLFEKVLIFSNLFGPVLGSDEIPNYKLKQGAKIAGVDAAKHYKKEFSQALDEMFEGAELLDLRAGYYEKFYEPKVKSLKPKFLKGGKVVSHNAKEHRGLFLREVAKSGAELLSDVLTIEFKSLKLVELFEKNNCIEPLFETASF